MFGGYCAKLVYMGIIDGITVRPNFVQANGNKYNTFTLQQHKRRCCWLWSSQRFCELTLKHSTVGELKWVNTQIRLTMNGIGLAKWNIVTWLKELTAHWICPLHACRVQRKWDCHIMWTRFTVLFGIFFCILRPCLVTHIHETSIEQLKATKCATNKYLVLQCIRLYYI